MGTPVIINEGLNRIAQLLLDDLDYCGVGTGTNAPAAGDSQLQTETNRQLITKGFRNGNVANGRFLFENSNLPSTLQEIGAFLNATASANNGEMAMRTLETFVKGSADLLVVTEFTVSEA